MKRTPMKRRTPLRSKPKHQPAVEREPRPMALSPATRRGTYQGSTNGQAVEKENASQHRGYMDAVKGLGYCMRCGCQFPQYILPDFCHRNMGKGKGIKTDVREGWPGCRSCHTVIDSGGLPREIRRLEELELGRLTRAAVLAAGTWPKNLPLWRNT